MSYLCTETINGLKFHVYWNDKVNKEIYVPA